MRLLYQHLSNFRDLYLYFVVWVLAGLFLPRLVAAGLVAASFLLVIRTKQLSKIFIAFIAMLILSDSRTMILRFAAEAKIGFVLIFAVYMILNFKSLKKKELYIFRVFVTFLAFAVLASLWSESMINAFQKSISYGLIYFLIPVGFTAAIGEDEDFQFDFVYFLTIILTLGLVLRLILPEFTMLEGRYRGLLGNPNGLGIFLTVTYPIYYLIRMRSGELWKGWKFDLIFHGVFILSLLLSGSRTALFAFLIFLFFNQVKILSNYVSLVLFIGLIIGYEYFLQQLPLLISSFGLEEYLRSDTLSEGSGRFVAWAFAWQQINEVLFTGGGFGYTENLYTVFENELSLLGHQGNAHNSYLTIWLDTGLIGISLYAIGLLRLSILSASKSLIALPIIFSVLFSTNFESWLSASLNPFTSLFLIIFTLLLSTKREVEYDA